MKTVKMVAPIIVGTVVVIVGAFAIKYFTKMKNIDL
jgi:hypothetical protein